jgi:hypothetical protein
MDGNVKLYLQDVKDPSKQYEVLEFDEKTQTATLKGKYAPFEFKPFTKENVKAKGYKLVRENGS